ncbi:vWA domain-containing protein [Haloferula rosea]|uniref:VWA domain-containing protein n=1 Tax=Haloferula rosea TaxID=490093 RepID=A0A934VFG4_9BACT|nr:VWA domain-containing protein [Haloferula rosea]MBK1827026.1 VWA domain-containing protein [Haloferula rosea]
MSLNQPWVLVLIPVIGWLLLRKRSHQSITLASTDLWPGLGEGRARFLPLLTVLKLVGFSMLVVAIARPQAGSTRSFESTEGIAIELLVDISSSMDFRVDRPDGERMTRMEVAKEIVERFVAGDGDRLGGRPHDLIGLITFARYPDTRSPLTSGHSALVQIIRDLEIQDRPNEDGTAYGDALALAAARLKRLDELEADDSTSLGGELKSRVIVLLTDGENNSGHHLPLESAALAKEWGCRVYVISLGQDEATEGGMAPELTAAEQVLERISEETGGLFRQAGDYESLLSVYEEIDELETTRIETRTHQIVAEWFWLPLSVALASFVVLIVVETTWLRIVP